MAQSHITVKELTPVVIATTIWGQKWTGQSILFRCDNMATVAIINSSTSHNSEAMHLVRCLMSITAKFQLLISAIHIAGEANTLADAISRNNLQIFFSLHPQAHQHQTVVPSSLVELLIGMQPDWISRQWTELWNNIFLRLS